MAEEQDERQYLTASQAALATGWSLRTITSRLAAGTIADAERIHVPGQPWQWRIPRSSLEGLKRPPSSLETRVAALEAEVARLARLLEGAAGPRTLPAQAQQSDSPLSASLVQPRNLPADWELLTDFSARHGVSPRSAASQRKAAVPPFLVHAQRAGTKQFWYLDTQGKRAALAYWFAGDYRPREGTHVQLCSVVGCPCHELVADESSSSASKTL
jgi:hypothetical protein